MKKIDILRLIIGLLTLFVIIAGIGYSISLSHVAIRIALARTGDMPDMTQPPVQQETTGSQPEQEINEVAEDMSASQQAKCDTNEFPAHLTSVSQTNFTIHYRRESSDSYVIEEDVELSLFECILYLLMIILPILNGVLFVIAHKNGKHIEK